MVLVVGPTGSGKTTTLYSILDKLNISTRKIVTLEDPVEYSFEGVTQIPVNTKSGDESFAETLRGVLRLDPDVIMIGEIRDIDTAKTALQASLTGHLVLSTFHAADAASALTRMLDVIGDNPLFANAIRLIVAQRLVRRLDDATKQSYEPDERLASEINKIVERMPEGMTRPNLDQLKLYKPGTSSEIPFGYKGRLMIAEQLKMSPDIQKLLLQGPSGVTTKELKQLALEQGMTTLIQDGILKAVRGQTTVEEVYQNVDI
jgi:type II secretory ATPase GspE/PulE/Tfp pilus assembly ATPase PilB-like protein